MATSDLPGRVVVLRTDSEYLVWAGYVLLLTRKDPKAVRRWLELRGYASTHGPDEIAGFYERRERAA